MQVHNVRVETVSGMSTNVDIIEAHTCYNVETVSGMSTNVDLQWVKKHPLVETVSEMSTWVDTKNIFNFFIRLKL